MYTLNAFPLAGCDTPYTKLLVGSFTLNGSSDPTIETGWKHFTVSRSTTGTYLVTLKARPDATTTAMAMAPVCTMGLPAASAGTIRAELGEVSLTAGTFKVRSINTSNAAADVSAATDVRITFIAAVTGSRL